MSDLAGLSELQIEILSKLEPAGAVRWKPRAWRDSGRAAWSKALRRLEQRGLITRLGPDGRKRASGRTYAVRLTGAGRKARSLLTS